MLRSLKTQIEPGNSGVFLRRVSVDLRRTHLELNQARLRGSVGRDHCTAPPLSRQRGLN